MSKRLSRRAFLGGSAVAAAAAGAGAAGILLRRDDGAETPALAEFAPTPVPTAIPTPTSPKPGGSQTITAPGSFNFDTFDAQLTGESGVVEVLGRTHSRLVQWAAGKLTGDLAQRWETPDPLTLILHLDPAARWHPRPPLNGRVVTADDVVVHLKRSLEIGIGSKAPLAQGYHAYGSIASVDAPAAGQVRIRLNATDEFILDILASEFALIQAPEAVAAFAGDWSKLDSDHVIGSGPWLFDWADDGIKFTAWRDGHRKPLLDELHVVEPADAAQRFADGSLDEAMVFDRRDAQKLRVTSSGSAVAPFRVQRELIMSSFFIGAPPWNHPELVTALSVALNRHPILTDLLGGRAIPAGPIPGMLVNASVSEKELVGLPGYGPWDETAAKDAVARWQAAGGPGLGTVTIDFPSIFDPLYSASSMVVEKLNSVLGAQFRPAVETYTTISKRVVEGYYGKGRPAFWFGWGAPISSPDARRFASATYAPGSPGQRSVGGAGFGDPMDGAAIGKAGFGGFLHWAQPYNEVFRKRSISAPDPSPFWNQHLDYLRANR